MGTVLEVVRSLLHRLHVVKGNKVVCIFLASGSLPNGQGTKTLWFNVFTNKHCAMCP